MYITRAAEPTVQKLSEMVPVLLVTGPRQVGKTTLLQKLMGPDRKYVTIRMCVILPRRTPPCSCSAIRRRC